MTETTGITVSNFLAGAIALGVALLIIPDIVEGQVGSGVSGINNRDFESLYTKINSVCDDNAQEGEEIYAEVSLNSKYSIQIDGDMYSLHQAGEIVEGQGHQKQLSCTYNDGDTTEKTIEGTAGFTLKNVDDDSDDKFKIKNYESED
jgi:hypothetical protein